MKMFQRPIIVSKIEESAETYICKKKWKYDANADNAITDLRNSPSQTCANDVEAVDITCEFLI